MQLELRCGWEYLSLSLVMSCFAPELCSVFEDSFLVAQLLWLRWWYPFVYFLFGWRGSFEIATRLTVFFISSLFSTSCICSEGYYLKTQCGTSSSSSSSSCFDTCLIERNADSCATLGKYLLELTIFTDSYPSETGLWIAQDATIVDWMGPGSFYNPTVITTATTALRRVWLILFTFSTFMVMVFLPVVI